MGEWMTKTFFASWWYSNYTSPDLVKGQLAWLVGEGWSGNCPDLGSWRSWDGGRGVGWEAPGGLASARHGYGQGRSSGTAREASPVRWRRHSRGVTPYVARNRRVKWLGLVNPQRAATADTGRPAC
ncbi:hypothetical protein GCM10010215_20250 [Streptomyces virginiae]|uniref:Uncharacterized protein n=1 Tax=Streptomyces virginiae TaxID=1961 RepID=A0ABQ3NQQ2_STRVG|nr:hypothetical protein GCM10010215_20250 [Streptomyces virginiae]GHI15096.1 hypothetical protein Scinn_45590 [Streptomyces virginiae]